MSREEFLRSHDFHIVNIVSDLYGISGKDYNNPTVKTLVKTAIDSGKIPVITYVELDEFIKADT